MHILAVLEVPVSYNLEIFKTGVLSNIYIYLSVYVAEKWSPISSAPNERAIHRLRFLFFF